MDATMKIKTETTCSNGKVISKFQGVSATRTRSRKHTKAR